MIGLGPGGVRGVLVALGGAARTLAGVGGVGIGLLGGASSLERRFTGPPEIMRFPSGVTWVRAPALMSEAASSTSTILGRGLIFRTAAG